MTGIPIPGAGTAELSSPMQGVGNAIQMSNEWGKMLGDGSDEASLLKQFGQGHEQAGLQGILNGGGPAGQMAGLMGLLNGGGPAAAPNAQFQPLAPPAQTQLMPTQWLQSPGVSRQAGLGATPGGYGAPTMGYGGLASGNGVA